MGVVVWCGFGEWCVGEVGLGVVCGGRVGFCVGVVFDGPCLLWWEAGELVYVLLCFD